MANFLGSYWKDVYKRVLQIGASSNTGVSSSLQTIQDGAGTSTALQLSTVKVASTGDISAAGNGNIGGNLTTVGDCNIGGNLTVTGTGLGKFVQQVSIQDGAVYTGTTLMVADDTIPQNTEGDQYMSLSITPTSSTNRLKIEVLLNFRSTSAASAVITALFQDSTANALAAVYTTTGTASTSCQSKITFFMTAGTTSSTTFKVRAGAISSNTMTVNGSAGARLFGGVYYSSISVVEYVP